ncbi:ABC transporter permease [Bacillus horti]|uniref:Hydroxymethylpyrimidine transport system permease protein n=1 Tax=Caldalkalibacillus horti TaxID=77523 RepID=A0ABT9VYG2_9BACI|nr:ABC transporter permease [Bacillus horti]MDQ0166004.1 putative hydroxymethylpyrimidine transport system permease protein [Bacillus horti]
MRNVIKKYGAALSFVLVLLVIWEIWARIYDKKFIIPSPVQILIRLWELKEVLLLHHLPSTLLIVSIGLLISLIFGVGLAALMSLKGWARSTFYPVVIASQTIPIIALAPIFVLWFGYSIWAKVAVTVLITFFPIAVNTYDGFRSVSKEYKELLLTMGARPKDIFLKLSVPSALPHFFSGLKVAVTLSVIGAAIGEWLGAQSGLGYFSRRMMTQFDGPAVFAPILLLSVLGIILFLAVSKIEAVVLKWRKTK